MLAVVGHDRERQYFCLLGDAAWEAPPDLGGAYELVPWPERPLGEVRDELAALDGGGRGPSAAGSKAWRAGRERLAGYAAQAADALRVAGGPHRHGRGRPRRVPRRLRARRRLRRRARRRTGARLGRRLRRPRAGRGRPRPAPAVPLREAGAHDLRLPAHLPGVLGVGRRLGLPPLLQPVLRDDRRRRRLRHAPADPHGGPAVEAQEGAAARLPHDVHRRRGHAVLGGHHRQLLRHPHPPAVPRGPRGALGAGARQPHRPVLLHRRRAPLVRARVERGDLRQGEDLEQAPGPGGLAHRGLVAVLPRAPGRAGQGRAQLPALLAGRRHPARGPVHEDAEASSRRAGSTTPCCRSP